MKALYILSSKGEEEANEPTRLWLFLMGAPDMFGRIELVSVKLLLVLSILTNWNVCQLNRFVKLVSEAVVTIVSIAFHSVAIEVHTAFPDVGGLQGLYRVTL